MTTQQLHTIIRWYGALIMFIRLSMISTCILSISITIIVWQRAVLAWNNGQRKCMKVRPIEPALQTWRFISS